MQRYHGTCTVVRVCGPEPCRDDGAAMLLRHPDACRAFRMPCPTAKGQSQKIMRRGEREPGGQRGPGPELGTGLRWGERFQLLWDEGRRGIPVAPWGTVVRGADPDLPNKIRGPEVKSHDPNPMV